MVRAGTFSRSITTLPTTATWRPRPIINFWPLQEDPCHPCLPAPNLTGPHHATRGQTLNAEGRKSTKTPMLVAQAAMVADPGASRKGLAERANRTVTTSKVHERLHHAKSLASQGELHHLVEDDAATLWSETVQHLPRECLKFALNAAQDTLPHNANLAIWRRREGLSDQCKLCSEQQTLSHVLNHCKVALDLRRYNARHDVVLMLIADVVKSNVS